MSKDSNDNMTFFMKKAVALAKRAAAAGEVPIGCVIEYNGKIIARGFNQRKSKKTTLAHAEILAIDKASKKLNDVSRDAQCMSPLNHARCVRVPLSSHVLTKLLSEP